MDNYLFKSERVIFKKWDESNIDLARKLWGNKEVTKYISAAGYFTEDEINNRLKLEIDNYKKYRYQYFPIYLIETNEFIGCCGLRPYDNDKNILEIGVHILPDFWKKGLGTEVMKRVIDYAFNNLKVANLFAGHNPNNNASKKLLEKIGFHFVRNEFYKPTGLLHPSYLFKID